MKEIWTHREFRLAGEAGVILAVRPAGTASRLGTSYRLLRTPKLEPVYFFLLACTAAFIFTLAAFLSARPVYSVVSLISPELGQDYRGSANKAHFLAKLSSGQRTSLLSNVHFIRQIIRSHDGKMNETDKDIANAIVVESLKADYDPLTVAAIIRAESSFNRHAVSSQGARGLMQLLPSTAKYISNLHDVGPDATSDLKDIEYNIRLGIAYLRYLEDLFKGNREHALIAYNWGPANLSNALKNGTRIPGSTVQYARKILHNSRQWKKDLDSRMAALKYLNVDSLA